MSGLGHKRATVPEPAPRPPPSSSLPVEQVRAREWAIALRNGLKMGGSLLITWSVALIVKLRVPAYLGPVRQGDFGFADSFAAMFFAVLGLGIETHLIKEAAVRPKYASDIVGGVLILRILVSLVIFPAMAVVLWATGRSGGVLTAVMVFGAGYHLMAVNATLGAVLQANSRVGPAVVANIVTKVLWGAGLLLGLRLNASLPFLALPVVVGEALRMAILVAAAKTRVKSGGSPAFRTWLRSACCSARRSSGSSCLCSLERTRGRKKKEWSSSVAASRRSLSRSRPSLCSSRQARTSSFESRSANSSPPQPPGCPSCRSSSS